MILKRSLGVALAALLAATVATACEPTSAAVSVRPVGHSKVAPATGAAYGIYMQPGTRGPSEQKAQITASETANGRKYDIVHTYEQWTETFPGWREDWIVAGGRTPMLSWAGPTVTKITSGSQDAVIDARARGLKAFGKPVLLRWFWEMDGAKNLNRAVSPTEYKKAWRRIVTRFRNIGATNVEFVWCTTAYGFVTGEAPKWYPGDDVVDWTCADGYNWAPNKPGATWTSFQNVYGAFYAWASQRPRPIMAGEFGVMEDPSQPGRKAAWIDAARSSVKTAFPKFRAVVYFHGDGSPSYPWYIDSTSSSVAAWKRWAQDPYFRQ